MFKSLIAAGLVCAGVKAASGDFLSLLEPYYSGYLRDKTLCADVGDTRAKSRDEGRWTGGKSWCSDDSWFRLGDGAAGQNSLSDDNRLDPTLFEEHQSFDMASFCTTNLSCVSLEEGGDPAGLAHWADDTRTALSAAWFSATNDADRHPGDSVVAHRRMTAGGYEWWSTGNPQSFSYQGGPASFQLSMASQNLALSYPQDLFGHWPDIEAGEPDAEPVQQAKTQLKNR